MTTRDAAVDLVRRMHDCFNTRAFERAADLHTPDFVSHPLGATGFDAGPWRTVTARFPDMRVVARDVLVDGDRVAVRSAVEGIEGSDPELIEIFRLEGGRFAEAWGVSSGFPASASPEDLLAGAPQR